MKIARDDLPKPGPPLMLTILGAFAVYSKNECNSLISCSRPTKGGVKGGKVCGSAGRYRYLFTKTASTIVRIMVPMYFQKFKSDDDSTV